MNLFPERKNHAVHTAMRCDKGLDLIIKFCNSTAHAPSLLSCSGVIVPLLSQHYSSAMYPLRAILQSMDYGRRSGIGQWHEHDQHHYFNNAVISVTVRTYLTCNVTVVNLGLEGDLDQDDQTPIKI